MSGVVATEASETLRLATGTTLSLTQKAMPYLECALTNLEQPKAITSMPWARAQIATEQGLYDGFFMASRNHKRDQYAVLSEPFFNIDWVYIVRKESDLLPNTPKFQQAIFVVDIGSARSSWLKDEFDNGHISHEIVKTFDATIALTMLASGRVDIALLNNINSETAFKQTGYSASDFQTFVIKSIPVGVYFSKTFLATNPDFLENFNTNIKRCKIK